jgi:hypothetical protein
MKIKSKVYASGLDDRLGVYTVLDLLPSLGVKADILITNHEEICASTARYFGLWDRYNWIAEFDRGGGDAVTYDLTSPEFDDVLTSVGFKLGIGSYSDICESSDELTCAVNIGIGYQKAHQLDSYFVPKTYRKNIRRFLKMYESYGHMRFDKYNSTRTQFDWDGNSGLVVESNEHFIECFGCGDFKWCEQTNAGPMCEDCRRYFE